MQLWSGHLMKVFLGLHIFGWPGSFMANLSVQSENVKITI